ncbi:AarF/ABC1/UbiB kinase family protein [Streptomyces sp. WELS2]|uniref:ABC1 kinase family protein n=1 Tax=Streptomyces sp. WELS2 TaxID=2749435 RepID=UPI0015F0C226|nr:AarF/UbiB family protein [Streptomyces sp. WELS2]
MNPARTRLLARIAYHIVHASVRKGLSDMPGDRASGTSGEVTDAVAVRQAFEALGPLYMKVGQILSTRPDIVAAPVAKELEHLHDRAAVLPFHLLEPVLEESLGRNWHRRFHRFDTAHPIGTASLAQVYAATLTDGRPVAVKVQRPGIRFLVEQDMKTLRRLARFFAKRAPAFNATIDVDAMLGVVFDAMRPELDFTLEARNMERARLAARHFSLVTVPRPLDATPKVLIQSLAAGTSIRDANPESFSQVERKEIGRQLLAFMFHGYFIDMTFHADPHPGNIFVAAGRPATVIDWGMIGHIDRRQSMSLMLGLLSLSQNDGHALAKAWVEMGKVTPWADVSSFTQDMAALVPRITSASLEELNFGATLTSVLTSSTRRGIQTSSMISILGKSFANAEGSVRYLAPELSVTDVFREEIRAIVTAYLREASSEQQVARTLMEGLISSLSTPGEIRGIIRDISNQDLTIQVAQAAKQRLSPRDDRADARLRRVLQAVGLAALVWRASQHRRR